MKPLHVAIVWHMHQPYYKDDLTSTYLLPWVRLRACKDYYKMAALLDNYRGIRQTFNLVPSLLVQIEDYVAGESQDLFLNLSRKPAAELSAEERRFILRWMRESPQQLRVQASQRYMELAGRAEDSVFSVADMRDLQVWFNLAWCDPAWVETDPKLSALKAKDREFTEEDKEVLFSAQLDLMRLVIPKYRELADRGQVELTFSPYYHPILPLICHLNTARTAIPDIALPETRFSHPEDAQTQISQGIEVFERLLGRRPRGMWPSELAVGESVARLAVKTGVSWFVGDEDTLARSLDVGFSRDGDGRLHQPELLYAPYSMEREGGEVRVVFRDSTLSNLVGFDYQATQPSAAAQDLMRRLRQIREQQGDRDFLVTIALDGENPWEFYSRDGHDFLNALYSELEAESGVVTTTVSDFLARGTGARPLQWIHTGSWIGNCLDTWIGDPEHNLAWELLSETRDWLQDHAEHRPAETERLEAAWREIYVTEGSDWFWWFSRRHDSGMDTIWDHQFRLHLRNVYRVAGRKPPARLFQPIIERSRPQEGQLPISDISPRGADDPAWEKAGRFEVGSGFGDLHRPVGVIERVLYGGDDTNLYMRLDSSVAGAELAASGVELWVLCSGSRASVAVGDQHLQLLPRLMSTLEELDFEPGFLVRVQPSQKGAEVTVSQVAEDPGRMVEVATFTSSDPAFLAIPFDVLGKQSGMPMSLAVVVAREGRDVEQIPPEGSLRLRVPSLAVQTGSPSGLKVLIAAAEVAPLAKAGGVADVTAALAKELRRMGHDARLIMPRYRQVNLAAIGAGVVAADMPVTLGSQQVPCTLYEARLGDVPVYLVDCPQLFDRPAMFGFGDDDARFIYFSRAVIAALRPLGFMPQVIHVNDWHTALIPNLLDKAHADDSELTGIAAVLTVHNLAFQGTFGSGALHLAGLDPWGLIKVGIPHLDDVVNILGRGIHFADAFNTVSERYAREIQMPDAGEGLDKLIQGNAYKLYGIINGIDYEVFDPATDPVLPQTYSSADLSGKSIAKAELRRQLGLPQADLPLIVMISRLYETKGLDLVEQALPTLLGMNLQMAVLGAGDRHFEDLLRFQAAQAPERLVVQIGFDQRLAQLMYAGADMLLMPSRSEPGGLGQLIGMRYGTVPIVRATGGLVDTVQDVDPQANTGFGFVFEPYDAWHLLAATIRAVETYKHRRFWREVVRRAMTEDVSWAHSARRYAQLYRAAIASHLERSGHVPASAGKAG